MNISAPLGLLISCVVLYYGATHGVTNPRIFFSPHAAAIVIGGTTVGMITLLQGLGEPNAFDRLGPSMSVALVATFYGLIIANVVLIPIGENLAQSSEEDLIMRRIVVDGVRLLKAQKH